MIDETKLAQVTATAILGIDTLWGGDVMNPSGTGRFIADSWYSDEKLPPAYTHPGAARLRETGGVAAKEPDRAAVDAYLVRLDAVGRAMTMAQDAYASALSERDELRGRLGAYAATIPMRTTCPVSARTKAGPPLIPLMATPSMR